MLKSSTTPASHNTNPIHLGNELHSRNPSKVVNNAIAYRYFFEALLPTANHHRHHHRPADAVPSRPEKGERWLLIKNDKREESKGKNLKKF